ncbi:MULTISPECIES: sugar-binding transcriptional regulator [Curtobacterium]|jgi:DNA-binding transcriptional regulator LsrR (DeoR family)|uniref:Sugar-binding domain-containing protein n=1 Tax=Curtobacterium citri TaxID=3055139 RepID=A0ABT7T1Z3_9MICO|nr:MULTISPECIES: sugar-binding domain-containing protein [Curtobacterium]MDM7883597.1 sugar-binding domain-containing protein [Curtobacterium citri]
MSSESTTATEGARGRFPLDTVYQAARMYYLEDATQGEIAERLGVSRPTVSRLVSEARRAGLVRIEVVDPFQDETVALAERLQVVLGLRAVHLAAVTHQATLGADLAGPIATAVEGMGLVPGDAVLMSSGRTVSDVAHAGMPPLTGVQLVPTVGGQADPTPWFQTNEITRAAAQRSGAIPAFLFAQALPSAAMRATLDEDPAFQHVVGLWGRAKGAFLGIGAPVLTREAFATGLPVDDAVLHEAAGDVCLNFFAPDGSPVEFPGSERMVRTSREVLAGVPHAVGVAVGAAKVTSIVGAVRAGMVNELVTDAATARALLDTLG